MRVVRIQSLSLRCTLALKLIPRSVLVRFQASAVCLLLVAAREVSVLRKSLVLCYAVLDHFRGTLRGKAVDQCFVTVIGGIADEDVKNGMLASATSARLTAPADVAVQQQLVEQLGAAVTAVTLLVCCVAAPDVSVLMDAPPAELEPSRRPPCVCSSARSP